MQAAQSVGPALRGLPVVGALPTASSGHRPALLALSLAGALGVGVAVVGLRARPPEERTPS